MNSLAISRLLYLCDYLPGMIRQIRPEDFSAKPGPEKWSRKEILGHLVDSAANNHHRFVRSRYESNPPIAYIQNDWVRLQDYPHCNPELLISLWKFYNRHLAWIISRIPDEDLPKTCRLSDGKSQTLSFLAEDYVDHLEHHLHQILEY